MFDIITIGSATRDVFMFTEALHPHRNKDSAAHLESCLPFGSKINIEAIHYDTGGGATNSAVTFARLGKFKVATIARLGADSRAKSVLDALHDDEVNTAFIQITPQAHTAYSAILSPAENGGERTILTYRGASAHIEHNKIHWRRLQTRWFYVTSLAGDLALFKKIVRYAQKIGAQVAWNPGGQELSNSTIRTVIASAAKQSLSFLLLNREEASRLTGIKFEDTNGLLRALAKLAPATLMTDGSRGAYAVTSSTLHTPRYTFHAFYIPSGGSRPKNLTGAGDAFGSGFITSWIKSHGNLEEALHVGTLNANSVVQHVGAKVGILKTYPSLKQLEKLSIQDIRL